MLPKILYIHKLSMLRHTADSQLQNMAPYECDECGILPIRGIAWKCESCADYHLCDDCKNQGIHGFAHHSFATLEGEPVNSNEPYPFGSTDAIMDDPDIPTLRRLKNDYAPYEKLNVQQKEIRLLTIVPSAPGTELTCVIAKFPAPWKPLNYTTVSYSWGDFRNVRTIRMAHVPSEGMGDYSNIKKGDFREYQVTRGLYRVLKRLRCNPEACREESHKGKLFWIDALSINQGDLEERSHQVTFMGDIYSNARRVEVFLNSCALKEYVGPFMRGLSGSLKLSHDVDPLGHIHEICQVVGRFGMRNPRTGTDVTPTELVEELAKIFNSPWFHRVWVVQEVMWAAKDAVVCRLSHDGEVKFRDLLLAFNYFRLATAEEERTVSYRVPVLWAKFLALQRANSATGHANGVGLDILQLFSSIVLEFESTDPRDMLFSIVDLSNDASTSSDGRLLVSPNYRESTSSVYAHFTKAHIRYHKSLDILSVLNEVQSTCKSCIPESESLLHPTWALWPHMKEKWKRGNLLHHAHLQTEKLGDVDTTLLDNCSNILTLPLRGLRLAEIEQVLWPPVQFINTLDYGIQGWTGWCVGGDFAGEDLVGRQAAAQFWTLVKNAYQERREMRDDEEVFEMFLETFLCLSPSPAPDAPKVWQRPDVAERLAAYWVQATTDPDMALLPPRIRQQLTEALPAEDALERAQDFAEMAHESSGRRFFVTETGRLGLCPLGTRSTDVVVALLGGRVPYVLRRDDADGIQGDGVGGEWTFVGECYINGMMDGTHVKAKFDDGRSTEVFHLR